MSIFKNGFNNQNTKIARFILEKHLQAAAKEMGVERISLGNIRYTPNDFTVKLSVENELAPNIETLLNTGDNVITVGSFYKMPFIKTIYRLLEIRDTDVIVRTDRVGGTKYRVDKSDFNSWIKVG